MRSLLLAVSLSLMPSLGAADSLEVIGGADGAAKELAHSVDVTLEPGVAILRVDRTIEFSGRGRADVVLLASLPRGGVVTAVSLEGGGEVEVQAREDGVLLLFPDVRARSKRRVTYRVEVPLIADHNEAMIWMPQAREDEGALAPIVRLGGEVLIAEDNPGADPVRVPLPTPSSGRARWGAARLNGGWVWRLEVDAPHSLSTRVERANVVFLLDVSRSQARKGIERQLALLQQWAVEMPKARYQVVAYARNADVVFATWKGTEGVRDLGPGHAKLVPQNGSNLDAALEVAATVLAQESGPAFVLVGTDGEVPVGHDPKRMSSRLDGLKDASVVHLLLTSGRHTSGAIETRADDHRLGRIALDHAGVPVSIYLPDSWPDPPALVALENLLTVTRVDRYDAAVDNRPYRGEDAWGRLYEHRGVTSAGRSKAEPRSILPSGLTWGSPWKLDAARTEAVDRRAALFAVAEIEDLTAAELTHLGTKLKFVTPKTAIKASGGKSEIVEPRAVDVVAAVIGHGSGRGSKRKPEQASELSFDQVRAIFGGLYRPCVDAYDGPAATVQVSLEMSWNEVIDVAAVGADAATNRCVEEAIWAADLEDKYKSPHAFGMVEEPLHGTARDADDEGGPPETVASRSGGCTLGDAPAPWWSMFSLAVAGALLRRRD